MPVLSKWFLDHPRSVNETYAAHFRTAFGIGTRMVVGGMACIVHAVVPRMFVTTASDEVRDLYRTISERSVQPCGNDGQAQLDERLDRPQFRKTNNDLRQSGCGEN